MLYNLPLSFIIYHCAISSSLKYNHLSVSSNFTQTNFVLFTKLMHYELCQLKLPNYTLRSFYVLSKITSKPTMYKISPLSASPMSNHLVVRLSPLSDYLLSEYPLSEIHCQSYATTMVVKLYKISIIKKCTSPLSCHQQI